MFQFHRNSSYRRIFSSQDKIGSLLGTKSGLPSISYLYHGSRYYWQAFTVSYVLKYLFKKTIWGQQNISYQIVKLSVESVNPYGSMTKI